jgi:hypothetical protein
MTVRRDPGCPPGQPACGFKDGMGVLLYDRLGHFDLYSALAVAGDTVTLQHRSRLAGYSYPAGTIAAQVEARTYYVDTRSHQLRRYDTEVTDVPVLDHVVDMRVEYFGSPTPPVTPKPPIGEANCLYDASGRPLPGLALLTAGSDGHAPLPLAIFTDGPWCGDGDTRFDADLLRIRHVRITVRAQASAPALRGTGGRFAFGGTSQSVWTAVPDFDVTLDVSPRNLNLGP